MALSESPCFPDVLNECDYVIISILGIGNNGNMPGTWEQ